VGTGKRAKSWRISEIPAPVSLGGQQGQGGTEEERGREGGRFEEWGGERHSRAFRGGSRGHPATIAIGIGCHCGAQGTRYQRLQNDRQKNGATHCEVVSQGAGTWAWGHRFLCQQPASRISSGSPCRGLGTARVRVRVWILTDTPRSGRF